MKKSLLWFLALSTAMVGCTESDVIGLDSGNELNGKDLVEIQMSPTVKGVQAVTRAPFEGINGGVPSPGTPLVDAKVVARKASVPNYGNGSTYAYADGLMTFNNVDDAVGFSSITHGVKFFPTDGSDLYFIGLYPATGWTADLLNNVTQYKTTIDGKTDLMVAQEVTGNKIDAQAGIYPKLTFDHLLTRLDVKLVAKDADAMASWGNINGIVLDGVLDGTQPKSGLTFTPTTRALNFDTPVASLPFYSCTGTTTPTFGDTEYIKKSDALATTEPTYYAYTMMAPITLTGDNDVTLKIYVENGDKSDAGGKYATASVNLPTTTGTNTNGKYYTITLTFNVEEIKVSAEVTPWENGDESTGEIN